MAKRTTRKTTKKKPIESYDHQDKKRANNPPVGLVTPDTDPDHGKKKTYQYDPHLDPQLVWAGKAEHTSFEVPTVSLHVHERIDPRTIIEAVRKRNGNGGNGQMLMFEQPEQNPPLREAIEFYKHAKGWTNRLIAGDSLLVMNSLLEKEGMAGKVQMVYIDPPYGIRYKSNFQPFVNRHDVADSDRDDDLSQEPETIRAFRDTWELGIHSYLAYLRDRLRLSRELLSDTGSCFVQINDENLHLVRSIMDEIFGAACAVVNIPVKKKGSQKSGRMDPVNDYVVWYGRRPRNDRYSGFKYRPLFEERRVDAETLQEFKYAELPDGTVYAVREMPDPEGTVRDYRLTPRRLLHDYPKARLFRKNPLKAGGVRKNQSLPYELDGKVYHPGPGRCWKQTVRNDDGSIPGMDRLRFARRLLAEPSDIRFKSYLDDFGFMPLSNWWDGLGGASDPIYVVQTNTAIVERCMLMTTDPGDLVLDPTCGSGTTAYVAEQWGRRWITCDTSRVSIALAKQRLMTPVFNYYELAHPDEGVGSGFTYRTVPHVEPNQIANNPEIKEGMSREEIDATIAKYADPETLYDQPFIDKSKARVSGPFTVEAVPAPAVRSISEVTADRPSDPSRDREGADAGERPLPDGRGSVHADASVGRSGETLRQDEWRDELLKCGIRGKKKQHIHFSRVETLSGTRWLHADAETAPSPQPSPSKGEGAFVPERVVVSVGPDH
ncbi:MAG: site-specific DNA-methyltransferase, partial [Planctomycetes bacterium]|nr:site-specific DNA-methyltransferase [Planctomycetota bacterium]